MAGADQRAFHLGDRDVPAFSIGGTEQFLLTGTGHAHGLIHREANPGRFGTVSPIVRSAGRAASPRRDLRAIDALIAAAVQRVSRTIDVGLSGGDRAAVDREPRPGAVQARRALEPAPEPDGKHVCPSAHGGRGSMPVPHPPGERARCWTA